MKLVTFNAGGQTRIGAYEEGWCYDLNAASQLGADGRPHLAESLKELLAAGAERLQRARALLREARELDGVARAGVAFAVNSVELLAPIPDPQKVLAIGQNYRDHCAEQNVAVPTVVAVFCKLPSAVIGASEAIVLPPLDVTSKVDYEAELAVVIGRRGVNIPEAEALEWVGGYTCCNDVSARDVQKGDGGRQWIHGKGFDTFCPLGPWLVTPDEIPDPHDLDIACDLNGVRMQSSHTDNLVFRIPWLIAELSKSITLLPGDIITTGTPGGVGIFRDPPVLLKDGDTVAVSVGRIGTLTNRVRASGV